MNKLRPFLFFTIIAAIVIAGTAALFSVTGISSLFSGHQLQVAIMAGALEAGKIVIASILYRYWTVMSKLMKSYMAIALLVLMIITSVGIFGYLSEAYQTTKGDYTIVEKGTATLNSKKNFFEERKNRLEDDKILELKTKASNQTRADSLTSRGQSITRTRQDIKESEIKIVQLEDQIAAMEDSIGVYDLRIVELESMNIKGELGPLTYIASALDMEMDDVVKWLILILIVVFDPLAVMLIVAANMIYINKHFERTEWVDMFNKKESPVMLDEVLEDAESIKKWSSPGPEYSKSEIKKIEKKRTEEINKEGEKIESEMLFPYEASPVDENAYMLDNTNEPINDSPDVKSDAPVIPQSDNISKDDKIPEKEPKPPRRWKSANWIEPKD